MGARRQRTLCGRGRLAEEEASGACCLLQPSLAGAAGGKASGACRLLQPSLAGAAEGKASGAHQLLQPSLAGDAGGEASGACQLQQPVLAGTAGGVASGACHWLQPPLAGNAGGEASSACHLLQPSLSDALLTDTAVADDGIATLVRYWHSQCSVWLIGAGVTDEGIAARAVARGHCPVARALEFGTRSLP